MERFGDKVICNPTVKLEKNQEYSFISIDKITPIYKTVDGSETTLYTGQSGSKFEDRDVLMARITPCLENGKLAVAKTDGKKGFGSTEFFVFRGLKDVTDTDYIYYLLCMPYMRELATNSMTGASGRQRADLGFIKKIPWTFPDISKQRRIAKVLSAFDELIEINNNRIDVVSELASNIYNEWFVRFRYPGCDHTKMKKSRLGKIPEEFTILKMEEVFKYYIGGGWGNDEPDKEFDQEAYVIRGTDFPYVSKGDVSTCPLRYHKPSNYSKREIIENDIILEVSGGTAEQPVGRTMLVDKDVIDRLGGKVICASFCKLIRLNDRVNPYYFYYWMQFLYDTRIIDRFQLQSTGIINFKFEYFLKKGDLLLPPAKLMTEFEQIIKPLHDERMMLARKNELLIRQRDLLLPRLMSGRLEV